MDVPFLYLSSRTMTAIMSHAVPALLWSNVLPQAWSRLCTCNKANSMPKGKVLLHLPKPRTG